MPGPTTSALTWLLAGTTPDAAVRAAIATWATTLPPTAHRPLTVATATNPHLTRPELDALATAHPDRRLVDALTSRDDLTADHITSWWPRETRSRILTRIFTNIPDIDAYAAERGTALDNPSVDRAILGTIHTSAATKTAAATRFLARSGPGAATAQLHAALTVAAPDARLENELRAITDPVVWDKITTTPRLARLLPTPTDTEPDPAAGLRDLPTTTLAWLRHTPRSNTDATRVGLLHPTCARIVAAHHDDETGHVAAHLLAAHGTAQGVAITVANASRIPDHIRKQAMLAAVDAAVNDDYDSPLIHALNRSSVRRYTRTDPQFCADLLDATCRADVTIPHHARGAVIPAGTVENVAATHLHREGLRWYGGNYDWVILATHASPATRRRAVDELVGLRHTSSTAAALHDQDRETVLDAYATTGTLSNVPVATLTRYLERHYRFSDGRGSETTPIVAAAVTDALGDTTALRDPAAVALLDATAKAGVGTVTDLLNLLAAIAT